MKGGCRRIECPVPRSCRRARPPAPPYTSGRTRKSNLPSCVGEGRDAVETRRRGGTGFSMRAQPAGGRLHMGLRHGDGRYLEAARRASTNSMAARWACEHAAAVPATAFRCEPASTAPETPPHLALYRCSSTVRERPVPLLEFAGVEASARAAPRRSTVPRRSLWGPPGTRGSPHAGGLRRQPDEGRARRPPTSRRRGGRGGRAPTPIPGGSRSGGGRRTSHRWRRTPSSARSGAAIPAARRTDGRTPGRSRAGHPRGSGPDGDGDPPGARRDPAGVRSQRRHPPTPRGGVCDWRVPTAHRTGSAGARPRAAPRRSRQCCGRRLPRCVGVGWRGACGRRRHPS